MHRKGLSDDAMPSPASVLARGQSQRWFAVTVLMTILMALALPSEGVSADSRQVAERGSSHLLQRSGTKLTLAGEPYRFVGINIYQAASGGKPTSCGGSLAPDLSVPLSQMPRGVVVRFWAFQEFFVSRGSFDWSPLDRVLKIAAAHGVMVIPVLANQHEYCDGPAKTLQWYRRGYKTAVEGGNVVTYRQFVKKAVKRYAGNPTIAMWQLVNEGEAVKKDGSCDEPAAVRALRAFSNDVGGLVHHLDSKRLVSLGVLAGWNGRGQQYCGATNGNYESVMKSAGNDVCDYHDYGWPTEPMGLPEGPNIASAIKQCHAIGKPMMVAETGIYASSDGALAARRDRFRAKFRAQFAAGVVGELMWAWGVAPQYVVPADRDPNYVIAPGDPSLGLLEEFGASPRSR